MGRIIFLPFCLLLLIPLPAAADYYDGLRAFDAKNYASALKLWQEAADQGDAKSQFRLGQLYQKGLGIPQNFVKAHLYYNLAGAQGDANARRARDVLAKEMTTEERAQARQLAANWVPKKTPAPSGAKASAKIAQPVDTNERLEQLRKRMAKLKQDRKLAAQSVLKKQSAVATVATTSRQAQGEAKTYRIGLLSMSSPGDSNSAILLEAEMAKFVKNHLHRNPDLDLVYSATDPILNEPRIRKQERLWIGGAVQKEPNLERVSAVARERNLDGVVMVRTGAACWLRCAVWVYVVDIQRQQVYRQEVQGQFKGAGQATSLNQVTKQLLAEFLAQRQGQTVYASASPSPATQSPATQQAASTVSLSSQPAQPQVSQPSQPKAAKRQKVKKRKAKTPYKLIASKQSGQVSNFKDGVERVVSQQGDTVVMLRPSDRILKGDLNLIVSVQNQTSGSFDFAPPNLSIHYAGQAYRAFTYDEAAALKAKKKTGFAGFFLMGMAQGAAVNAGLDASSLTQMQSNFQGENQNIDEAISAMEKTYMKRTTVGPNNVFAGIVTFGLVRDLGIGQPFEVWVTLPSAVHKFAFRVASP